MIAVGVGECAYWALVVGFSWWSRTLMVCDTCPEGPGIVAQRTFAAIVFSGCLAVSVVALVIFVLNRRRPGIAALAAVQVIDLAVTLFVGVQFIGSGDWVTALEWMIGSGLVATLMLGLLYAFTRSSAATPGASTRIGKSPAPGGA